MALSYPLFDPATMGTPKIGQPILLADPQFPNTPILDYWAGNVPYGQHFISQQQGIQMLKAAPLVGAPITRNYNDGTSYVAGYSNTGYDPTDINKKISDLSTLSGQFEAHTPASYEKFNPDATDLSQANYTPEYKAKLAAEYGNMVEIAPGEYVPKGGAGGTLPPAPTGTLADKTMAATGAPTVNLQPGDTGADVKKLQDFLVAKGIMTQAQVDTGYGTYGPQTTAAVAALQKSLGVDNSTGVGYFGPRTIVALGGSAGGTTGGATGGSTDTTGTATGGSTDTTGTATGGTVDPGLLKILDNPNLTPDQKAAIQSIYGAVQSHDTDTAARIQAAMTAASQYSDPYFKAQIRLATDALSRGLSSKDGDLSYAESQKQAALDDLRANTAASKDKLSFDHQQELNSLATKYETDLGTTRDDLAASGFAESSRRARAEQILGDSNTGLVETSNKNYSYQTGNLDRSLASNEASTAADVANLQRLTSEGKLDLLRTGEQSVGTDNLAALGYSGLLGDVGGDIPHSQAKDALSFASNFVT